MSLGLESTVPRNDPDQPVSGTPAPGVKVSAVKARQGRMGKHTLVILIVSLILAVIAGIMVGLIPLGRA